TPIPGDFNGDGKADIATWRPSNGSWNVMGQGTWYYGTFGDQPLARQVGAAAIDRHRRVQGDFNGDARTDYGIWRPSTGEWHIKDVLFTTYGAFGDTPVPYDFDGDTGAEVSLWKGSDQSWQIKDFLYVPPYGASGDVAVPGDYDGDGVDDVAVWKPADGSWHVKDKLYAVYGVSGDVPVPADYDGDGKTDIAVWRPSDGTWNIMNIGTWTYGARGDVPVPADYTGDGKADIALWKADHSWHLMNIQYVPPFGSDGDIPTIGDFDADGKADIAVYRRSSANWYVLDRATGTVATPVNYGASADIPTVRPTGYAVDYTNPTVSISGGLYDARNQPSLTDGSITVSANDTYSGADRIVINATRANGTFGPIADSNRDCGSFMCWPRSHSYSTSISPGSLNWQAGIQHVRVDVYDNAGNVTSVPWDVQYGAAATPNGSSAPPVDSGDAFEEDQVTFRFPSDLDDQDGDTRALSEGTTETENRISSADATVEGVTTSVDETTGTTQTQPRPADRSAAADPCSFSDPRRDGLVIKEPIQVSRERSGIYSYATTFMTAKQNRAARYTDSSGAYINHKRFFACARGGARPIDVDHWKVSLYAQKLLFSRAGRAIFTSSWGSGSNDGSTITVNFGVSGGPLTAGVSVPVHTGGTRSGTEGEYYTPNDWMPYVTNQVSGWWNGGSTPSRNYQGQATMAMWDVRQTEINSLIQVRQQAYFHKG
ncbi:MAG TPA: VCBS repeat-containing protein, partial [Baekduia sp.]|nr:VCBS repeat-containing protein [Baekduia sp.]